MSCLVAVDQQRALTVSRKTERLVNLTIALLATKRYLTKSEIFRSVDGYEGSAESMERMFERDKDDLRNLGIVIEVGSFDPLFEDEAGYRILNSTYRFQLGSLSSEEVAILSLAAQAWKGAALESSALSALIKLKSIGIESDFSNLPALTPVAPSGQGDVAIILKAIASRSAIKFSYLGADLEVTDREVQPYGAGSTRGFWYLVGNDVGRGALRAFRCDRIKGKIVVAAKDDTYEIPQDFSISSIVEPESQPYSALLRVRTEMAQEIRRRGTLVTEFKSDETPEWDLLRIPFSDPQNFVHEILWHGDNIRVIEPTSLREMVIECLEKIVEAHG
jgi:proteasome accessory factor B